MKFNFYSHRLLISAVPRFLFKLIKCMLKDLHCTSLLKASSNAQMLGLSCTSFCKPIQNPQVTLVIAWYFWKLNKKPLLRWCQLASRHMHYVACKVSKWKKCPNESKISNSMTQPFVGSVKQSTGRSLDI